MTILGVLSSGTELGRGGLIQRTWNLAKAKQDPPLTEAGAAPAEVMWERITYFLKRVVPVANEYKVRLACHPHDPGTPKTGFRGVDRVLGTVDGLKKFVSIEESPYHGLNFCQGTVSEMLQEPGKELYDVIRYFGKRQKIFNVHFRNIKGKRDNFVETYPDEGSVNFVKAMMVYKEVGYPRFAALGKPPSECHRERRCVRQGRLPLRRNCAARKCRTAGRRGNRPAVRGFGRPCPPHRLRSGQ